MVRWEVGGRECASTPPHREIVSFRSCVRARGVSYVSSERKKSWSGPVSFIFLDRGSVYVLSEKLFYLVSQGISEDSKRALEESSQREVSERFPQRVLQRILKVSSRREF